MDYIFAKPEHKRLQWAADVIQVLLSTLSKHEGWLHLAMHTFYALTTDEGGSQNYHDENFWGCWNRTFKGRMPFLIADTRILLRSP